MGAVISTVSVPKNQFAESRFSRTEVTYGTVMEQNNPNIQLYRFPVTSDQDILPSSVDLREPGQGCYPYPLVGAQNALSNCSSMAIATAFECAQRLQHSLLSSSSSSSSRNWIHPSVLYNYYYARKLSGANNFNIDSGASANAAVRALMMGVATEKAWPYHEELVNVEPSIEAQRNALHQSATQTEILEPTLTNLKTTLHAGYPIIFSFHVSQEMDQWFKDRNKQISTGFTLTVDQFSPTSIVAAHTVLIVGYDDTILSSGAFLCRNSWGPRFGLDGHFWFRYSSTSLSELNGQYILLRHICTSTRPDCVNRDDCLNVYGSAVCS